MHISNTKLDIYSWQKKKNGWKKINGDTDEETKLEGNIYSFIEESLIPDLDGIGMKAN